MFDNKKCILVYGLPQEELEAIKKMEHKIIEITPEMCEMSVSDILSGLQLVTINNNPIKEKVILYNNFPEKELRSLITTTRTIIQGGILAIVTPTSTKWKINYLIEHLIEEREWQTKNRRG